ncbi:Steroid 17-alpha-hydroxylase/17,20 lyase [Termitomyces sp. T112]|nr:Steroid 17-alpha-hydroxylase/17,20 lyase [Termitomyces sp. T112]
MVESLTAYLESVVQQPADRDHDTFRTIDTYLQNRRQNIGARPSFVPMELDLDFPDDVFYHPVILELSVYITDLIILENDVASYNKEQALGDDRHNILTIAMHQFGIDFQGAMDWVINYHAEVEMNFLDGLKRVPSWGPKIDRQIKQYLVPVLLVQELEAFAWVSFLEDLSYNWRHGIGYFGVVSIITLPLPGVARFIIPRRTETKYSKKKMDFSGVFALTSMKRRSTISFHLSYEFLRLYHPPDVCIPASYNTSASPTHLLGLRECHVLMFLYSSRIYGHEGTRIHAHTARLSNACIPGTSMVDLFPTLNYLPPWMAKWKRDALVWHQHESEMFEGFHAGVAEEMVSAEGRAQPSFVTSLIETRGRNGLTDKEAAWLAGIMFSAGAETTTASVSFFLIAMIHYPDVMRKAQAQIDAVVGRERVPTFADRPHLP